VGQPEWKWSSGLHGKAYVSQDRKYIFFCLVPVAHTCNPSYSGGRDQEDCGSKPAWANSLRDPI
jgi:hypothetical protein